MRIGGPVAAAVLAFAGFATMAAAEEKLFGGGGLDPSFCDTKTVRQTVIYIDDMMMTIDQIAWATKIAGKMKATLTPGERLTVVRLSPETGLSAEMWAGCWPDFTAAQRQEIAKKDYIFSKSPLKGLDEQQNYFMAYFGTALTKIYDAAKRPADSVHFTAAKPPSKQILRALASDEGRFSTSHMTIRAVIYSDMLENSDLGSVYKDLPSPQVNYAKKLGSRFRQGVFYAFGVAEDMTGNEAARDRAKMFWESAIKTMDGTVAGFGSDLNLLNNLPVADYTFATSLNFDGQELDGKISALVDLDGNLVDSWIGFSRMSIAGLTGTLLCQTERCKLDGATSSGLLTDTPSERVTLKGTSAELSGQMGVVGTRYMYDLKATTATQ